MDATEGSTTNKGTRMHSNNKNELEQLGNFSKAVNLT
jgi:hypothetical protein